MNRFYHATRQIFKDAAPDLARAAVQLALDENTDQRVRSVLNVELRLCFATDATLGDGDEIRAGQPRRCPRGAGPWHR